MWEDDIFTIQETRSKYIYLLDSVILFKIGVTMFIKEVLWATKSWVVASKLLISQSCFSLQVFKRINWNDKKLSMH